MNPVHGAHPSPVCLTMDVEPDYGRATTTRILDRIAPFLEWITAERIPMTAFVTGRLIETRHPVTDQLLAAGVAVELHGYAHGAAEFGSSRDSHADEIRRGTEAYANRFGRVPAGYRAPAGVIGADDLRLLASLGYRYDSSVFPVRRKGRYDFRHLPRSPFRWAGPELAEFPVGRLAPRVPSGLSFINLAGPWAASVLIRRAARCAAGPHVVDGHFHNLFTDPASLATLPLGLRGLYRLGGWSGGFAGFRRLVDRLRGAGVEFASLHALATLQDSPALPRIPVATLDPRGTA